MTDKNFIKKFVDVFNSSEYIYETNQSLETLKDKVRFVTNQKKTFGFKYNLTGNLNLDNTFELSRIIGTIHINNGAGGPPVKIEGKLIEREGNKTNVEIKVKPNFVMILLPIIFGLIGIVVILYSILTWNTETLFGGFFLIVASLFWGLLKYTKDYYKSEFERALGLSENETIEEN